MRIAVLHNAIHADSSADERDVLIQADAVTEILNAMGHNTVRLTCDLNLTRAKSLLRAIEPDLVFNLVESLDGMGRLIHLFPCLLDALALPYTGAGADALMLTSNKLLAKAMLDSAGLPTPAWSVPSGIRKIGRLRRHRENPRHWILKSVWEHASVGLDDASIVESASDRLLETAMVQRAPRLGGACFAEAFIDGREFNLSLLDSPDGPQVLPPSEIRFEGFASRQARIVGYQAKWDEHSYAYHHTPRRFDFDPMDNALLKQLETLSLECWELMGLRGYARVDYRVDDHGQPWILEINANPCLSPDAGFAAAVHRAGLTMSDAVARIVAAAGQ